MRKVLSVIVAIVWFSVCAPVAKAQQSPIERFSEVVDSIHQNIVFPYTVGPGLVIMNVGVDSDDKMLVINYLLNPEMVEAVASNAETENGVAQLLTGYPEVFSTTMIDAGAGCRLIYSSPSQNGGNATKTVVMPASKIAAVYQKLKNGDFTSLKPYLETLRDTFSNLKLPVKVSNGILLSNAYIDDNDVYWVYEIEGEIGAEDISEQVIQQNRFNLVNNLRSVIAPDYVEEIGAKGIKLHYVYKNQKGEDLFELVFTANDLK